MSASRFVAGGLALVSVLGACSGREAVRRTAAVALRGIAFVPATVRIDPGASVAWTDVEDVEHTVTAGSPPQPEPSRFDRILHEGETFTFAFGDAGTYGFFCRRHPANMRGEVLVA